MITKILAFFAAIVSFFAAFFGFKFYKQKNEILERKVELTRHNKDVLINAHKAGQPTDYETIEGFKKDVQISIDDGNLADPFNPILPDDK